MGSTRHLVVTTEDNTHILAIESIECSNHSISSWSLLATRVYFKAHNQNKKTYAREISLCTIPKVDTTNRRVNVEIMRLKERGVMRGAIRSLDV